MPPEKRSVRLAPLLGLRTERVSDAALGGVHMRGGFNVEQRDGEWWVRKGECVPTDNTNFLRRIGSTQWTHILTANQKAVVVNPYWALELDLANGGVTKVYDELASESVSFTNGSASATATAHTPAAGELILVNIPGTTSEVYRVASAVGTAITLERNYEGVTDSYDCEFLPMLAQNVSGTNRAYSDFANECAVCVFEQLPSHSGTTVHAASPAVTAGHRYLIVTSPYGCPVAIDLSGNQPVKRDWFFNTSLATPARISTNADPGLYCETYRGRLFIGAAPDSGSKLPTRTFWYSSYGDLLLWHTGVQGRTAVPNYVTVSGPNDDISDVRVLNDDLIVHRQRSQTIVSGTGVIAQPFSIRSNEQDLGLYTMSGKPLSVRARGVHYIWTERGPAVFDGARVTLIGEEIRRALAPYRAIEGPWYVTLAVHDVQRGRIYWLIGDEGGTFRRHQDATAYGTTLVAPDGTSYSAGATALVHEYETGAWWLEDRPSFYGGGSLVESNDIDPGDTGAYLSRFDGTIVKMRGDDDGTANYTAKDAGLASPSTDAAVEAQVDTPWMDFDYPLVKRLNKVEVTLRPLLPSATQDDRDAIDDLASGNYWLRLRVYGDMRESAALSDVGVVYDSTTAQLVNLAEDRQPATFVLEFPVLADAKQFRFRFSNGLTAAATAQSYKQAPFRISEVKAFFAPMQSDQPRTTLNAGVIAATV